MNSSRVSNLGRLGRLWSSGRAEKVKHNVLQRFPALKHRDFRNFLTGQCISLVGTWMQRTAQQWVMYQLTDSPLALGLVGVCQFAPALFLSLFAGVLVDRYPKKQFLMITQGLQMVQALVLALLIGTGQVRSWHILVLAGFLGLANTFDMPVRQSFFAELVGKEDLVSAIGLNSSMVNLGRIVGPAVAGLFLAYLGAAVCFLFNGLSFIAVLIGLARIRNNSATLPEQHPEILAEIRDGLTYLMARHRLVNAVMAMLIVGTAAMNVDVIIPVFAKEVMHQQAQGYSLMLSVMGLGSLMGSLLVAGKRREEITEARLFRYAILLAVFLLLTGFLHNYGFALLSIGAVGLYNMMFMATVNSTIQLHSADEYRGRAMSVYTLVFIGTGPIGNFCIGWVTEQFGANSSFLLSGIFTLVLIIALVVFRKRQASL